MNTERKDLEVYLVGGAVRDELLGREVNDRDWVVVGATPQDMIDQGYKPVGRDFPVYLHPETREEYALARKERKTGPGYRGFAFEFSPDVTLKEDLQRRDLTINAMARDCDGNLIDYFDGRRDLEDGILRHVSPAFAEDPVRLLRIARFRARYGYAIAPETSELLMAMVKRGEVDALVAERVWQELDSALVEPEPGLFVETLRGCGALKRIFPEIDALFGVPQRKEHHPEVDAGVHTLMALTQARRLTDDPVVLFAALVHDLGKALTPEEEWPRHYRHEILGLQPIDQLCERYRVPTRYRELARLVCRYHLLMHRLNELKPKTIVNLLEAAGGFRDRRRIEQFITACQADVLGRAGKEDSPYPQGTLFRQCYEAANSIPAGEIAKRYSSGKEIGDTLFRERCLAVQRTLAENRTDR